jgi:hypothetical protein
METQTKVTTEAQPAKRSYHEPLLIRHEPLRNITGQKYGEKSLNEKLPVANEKVPGDETM